MTSPHAEAATRHDPLTPDTLAAATLSAPPVFVGPDVVGPDLSGRYRELAVHVVECATADPSIDYEKLEDILFTVDALAVNELGHPITGSSYVKHSDGPELLQPRLEELTDAVALVPTPGAVNPVLVALREADTSAFTAEELEIVDRVVRELDPSGTEGTEVSHDWMSGYATTRPTEEIPSDPASLRA